MSHGLHSVTANQHRLNTQELEIYRPDHNPRGKHVDPAETVERKRRNRRIRICVSSVIAVALIFGDYSASGTASADSSRAAMTEPSVSPTTSQPAPEPSESDDPSAVTGVPEGRAGSAVPETDTRPRLVSIPRKCAVRGDWLSKLVYATNAEYKTDITWQETYAIPANRRTIGGDPNVMQPGDCVVFPQKAASPASASADPEPENPEPTTPAQPAAKFVNPVHPVSGKPSMCYSRFGDEDMPSHAGGHKGTDMDTADNQLVYAPVSGTVVHAGYADGYGAAIVILMEDGKHYVTMGHVWPLDSVVKLLHKHITAGTPVGRTPHMLGDSTGSHDHVAVATGGIFREGTYQDAEAFFNERGVKLCVPRSAM